jgi:hypothetical protein
MMRFRLTLMLVLMTAGSTLALSPARPPFPGEQYYAIYMDGQKVGHARIVREVDHAAAPDAVTTSVQMQIDMARSGTVMRIKVIQQERETLEGQPMGFRLIQQMGPPDQHAPLQQVNGRIENGQLFVTIALPGGTTDRQLDWPEGAIMTWGMEKLSRQKGLQPGVTYSAIVFNPQTLTAIPTQVTVGEKESVDLLGRVMQLTKVTTTSTTPMGEMTVTSWVGDDFKDYKSTIPMMGMTMEMIACEKAFATAAVKSVPDFLDRLILDSPIPIEPGRSPHIAFTLQPTGKKPLTLPSTSNQAVEPKGETVVVHETMPDPKSGYARPYPGNDARIAKYLQPTPFVQSAAKEIRQLTDRAVGDRRDAVQAARAIEAFVRKHIKKKNLSVGYATALEVARSGEGDCSEHALLTAAMCRAAGIPARVLTGPAYVNNWQGRQSVFVPHVWVEAYVADGVWLPLDAALPHVDAGRIALSIGNGDLTEFFDILQTMGQFRIVDIKLLTDKPDERQDVDLKKVGA